jgi:hypothetical protein
MWSVDGFGGKGLVIGNLNVHDLLCRYIPGGYVAASAGPVGSRVALIERDTLGER